MKTIRFMSRTRLPMIAISLILIFSLTLGNTAIYAQALFGGEMRARVRGEIDQDFIPIRTAEEFKKIGTDDGYPLSGKYRLTADVSMDQMIAGEFSGVFDGNGYTVNLSISNNSWDEGLFQNLSGTVENLITTGYVTRPGGASGQTGAIVGCLTGGTVKNCLNKASISNGWEGNAGISGMLGGGTIVDCYNTGAIAGAGRAGGIANSNTGAFTIKNCYSSVCPSDGYYIVGGELQWSDPKIVENCYYFGSADRPGESHDWNSTVQGAAVKLTGDAITDPASYSGWDFENTWKMGANGPELIFEHVYYIDVTSGTADRRWAAEGDSVTVTADVPDGSSFDGWVGASGVTFTDGSASTATATFSVYSNVALTAAVIEEGNLFAGKGTESQPYLIRSAGDWDALSNYINNGGTNYSGKYFKLTKDIKVTTVLGLRPGNSDSEDRVFSGTFDGDGHTLDVDINVSGFAAPFAIAYNTTIKNLHVTGKVKSSSNHATGLVAAAKGVSVHDESYLTVQNVTVSADVSCNSHVAGVVGHAHKAVVTMENVVFDGSISASSIQGGFIGWGGAANNTKFSATFKDCIFAGTYRSGASFHPVAYQSGQGTVTLLNDFYTTNLGSGGTPVTPGGSGQIKLFAATVEKDGAVNYYESFADASNSANWIAGSALKLWTDVTTGSTVSVPSGEHTLDLNGNGIRMTGSGMTVSVNNGAVLNLYDTDTNKTHKFDVPSGAGLAVLNEASGNYTVNGGYITGGNDSLAGGVYVADGGVFNMYGGNVIGNQTTLHGGGVGTAVTAGGSAVFNMCGGSICYNTSVWGGGLNIFATAYINEGCSIHHNTATNGGGGIELERGAKLFMNGGAVTDNVVLSQNGGMWKGGGIHVPNGTECHFQGSVIVRDNYCETFGGAASNLFVRQEVPGKVILDAALTSGATIGVGTNGAIPFTITTGYGTYHDETGPEKYFFSDNNAYAVLLNNNSEAEIVVPPVARIINGETVANYGSLSDAINAWTVGSTLKLIADVTTSSTITVPSGEHTLDLNGHGIRMTGSGSVISVGNGATLNVEDSNPDVEHKFTVANAKSNGAGLATVNDSLTSDYKTFTGGYITGGSASNGGGIKVNGTAYLTLNGGTVIGNQSSFMGAGIKADNNGDDSNVNVAVNGGAVIYNTVSGYGAGICSDGGVTINGGTVACNVASNNPGGIHSHYLHLSGGRIENNFAGAADFAAGAHADHEVFISGDAVIYGNLCNGVQSNLDWDRPEYNHGHKLNVTGALTDGAKIGVTLRVGGTGIFTSGWNDKMGSADPAKYFVSDNAAYDVLLNNNGEAAIVVPPVARIINGETVANYGSLSDAINAWTVGSTLKLMADVTTSSTITVPSGEHTLDLNGHGIKAASSGYSVITVGSGADLAIIDSDPESTDGSNRPANVTGGYVTGGTVGENFGGGVTVDGGTLTLRGGAISGNANTYTSFGNCGGGGVHVKNGGAFYMEGGEISGNTAFVGGGICTYNGAATVSVTGGVIKNNITERFGSAIFAGRTENSTFRIGGDAEIVGNISKWTSDKEGEGTVNFVVLKLSGDPEIHGDWKTSGTSSKNTHINLDNSGTGIQLIELEGALTNDTGTAKMKLSPIYRWSDLSGGKAFVFTKNWEKYMGSADPAEYFDLDDDAGAVTVMLIDGEAAIVKEAAASVTSGGSTLYYSDFSSAAGAWTAGSTLKLLTDVTTSSTVNVPAGEHTLDLNGYNVTRTGADGRSNDGLVFTVNDGANLTVTGPGKITGGNGFHGGGIHVEGNSSLVLDNCEISGNAGHYGGGLYLKAGTVTLKNGATVTNNSASEGFGGSGIYAEGGGTLILEDCSFTGNTINNNGQYAVFLCGNANVRLCGSPVIYDNTLSGAQKNLYLYQEGDQFSRILFDGALNDGAHIGVAQKYDTGVITVGWSDAMGSADASRYFISDNADYVVRSDGKGELKIALPHEHVWEYTLNGNVVNAVCTRDGTCEFSELTLTISAENKTYDGSAVTASVTMSDDWTEGNGLELPGEITYTGNTDAGTYSANVSVHGLTASVGFTISEASMEDQITVTGFNGDYDGNSHNVVISAPDGAAVTFGTSSGECTLDESPEYTDAGEYTVYYKVEKKNYVTVTGSETVVISPIDVTVTITGHNDSVKYDGVSHSVTGYDAVASTNLYDVTKDFTFNGTASASLLNAGTLNMGLDPEQFENTNPNFGTVTFNVTDGYITIEKIDAIVTINGNSLVTDYDGVSHSASGYSAVANSDLYDVSKDFTFSGSASASTTNAATVYMNLAPEQFTNTNPNFETVTFEVTDGYVTVEQIDAVVTITGHNNTVDYDGTEHTVTGYDAEADTGLYDVTSAFTFSGTDEVTLTNAGTVYMNLDPGQFDNVDPNFATVTFEVTDGYVTVEPIDAVVKITGHYAVAAYDGKAHGVTGYDAEVDTELYDLTGAYTFSGNAEAESTDADTVYMGLSANQFENVDPNFRTVTFVVTDGYVKVEPINVTVKITGSNDTFDYNEKEQTVKGYKAVTENKLYNTDKDFKFTGSAEASRTNVGTTEMGLAADQFENTNKNFAKVTFVVTDGFITIEPVDATITVAPKEKELKSDGTEQALILAGASHGGTMVYALGADDKTAPADGEFKVDVPEATESGIYYVWYKVKGDGNHNDLDAVCIKATMIGEDWGNITGVLYESDGETPLAGATVTLISGSDVVDSVETGADGKYSFNAPDGVYNIVAQYENTTITILATVAGATEQDIGMPEGNTESILQVSSQGGSSFNIAVGGLEKEAISVRTADNVPAGQSVSVLMTVEPQTEDVISEYDLLLALAANKLFDFFNVKVEKTVDTVTTVLNETTNVLEIAVTYPNINRRDLAVYSVHDGEVRTFVESDSKEDGTFRIDKANGLIFIYTNKFSLYGIAYTPYFTVNSKATLGSFKGNVTVTLVNMDDASEYTLENVSMEDISFDDIPMGNYEMKIVWEDGAENTLTMPLTITKDSASKNNGGTASTLLADPFAAVSGAVASMLRDAEDTVRAVSLVRENVEPSQSAPSDSMLFADRPESFGAARAITAPAAYDLTKQRQKDRLRI